MELARNLLAKAHQHLPQVLLEVLNLSTEGDLEFFEDKDVRVHLHGQLVNLVLVITPREGQLHGSLGQSHGRAKDEVKRNMVTTQR